MGKQGTDRRKIKGRKAGIVAFGVTALLWAAIFPLYRIGDYALAAAVCFLVAKVAAVMGEGLDLNAQSKAGRKWPNQPEQSNRLPLTEHYRMMMVLSRKCCTAIRMKMVLWINYHSITGLDGPVRSMASWR